MGLATLAAVIAAGMGLAQEKKIKRSDLPAAVEKTAAEVKQRRNHQGVLRTNAERKDDIRGRNDRNIALRKASEAKQEAEAKVHESITEIRAPGKIHRLKQLVLAQSPSPTISGTGHTLFGSAR
jgi:hypothetical protein